MARTVKVTGIPSFVTQDDFTRLFAVDGCLEARLMGRQAQGDQLGYVEFTDASSASKSIMQYQGYLGLGGRGLALEPTQYTLGQLTGQPAIGLLADGGRVVNAAAAQKRQRDGDNNFHAIEQAPKQPRSMYELPPPTTDVAALIQGLDPNVLAGLLHSATTASQRASHPDAPQQIGAGAPPPVDGQQIQYAHLAPGSPLAPQPELYQPEFVPPTQKHTLIGGSGPRPMGRAAPVTRDYRQPNGPVQQTTRGAYPSQAAGITPPLASYGYSAPHQPYQQQSYAPPPPQQHQEPVQAQYGMGTRNATSQQQVPDIGQSSYPHDACSTLFVDGFPPDVTKRELAHLFRHFPGYLNLRLVIKDSRKYPGERVSCMAFIEYDSVKAATDAMNALQGYFFDLDVPQSKRLLLKYARPMEGGRGGTSHHHAHAHHR